MGTGNVTMNASRTITVSAGNLTVGGNLSGTGFALTKNGSGTLLLTGSNSYSGGTTVNGGTLHFQLRNNNTSFSGNTTYNINNGSTLRLSHGTGSAPLLQGTIINFDSNGGGTLNIGDLNGLVQSGGTFTINTNGGAQNNLMASNGYLNDQGTNGAVIFNIASGTNATADFLVTAGMGRNGITKNGTGKLLFTTTNVGTVGVGIFDIRINQGTMEFGGGVTLTQNSGSLFSNNGTLSWNSTANQTIANAITGTGNLTKANISTLTLSNSATSYSGLTTITAGTLAISNNMTIGAITGSGNLSLGTGFTLTTNSTTNSTFSGVISGNGALTKVGSGTLTLNGSNTFSGAITINGGSLVYEAPTAFYTFSPSGININNGSKITIQGSYGFFTPKVFTFDSNGGGEMIIGSGNNVFRGDQTFTTNGGSQNTISGSYLNCDNGGTRTFNIAEGTDDIDSSSRLHSRIA
jgi:autotransporter-associated beta strand protein